MYKRTGISQVEAKENGREICLLVILKGLSGCFIGYPNTEKRVENTTRSGVFLTKFGGVWIADETLPRVFDISSQSKQKLRNKRRSKIVKIYANLDRVSKPPSRS